MIFIVLFWIFSALATYAAISGAFYQWYFRTKLKETKCVTGSEKENILFAAMFWPMTAPFIITTRFVDKKFNNEKTKPPSGA